MQHEHTVVEINYNTIVDITYRCLYNPIGMARTSLERDLRIAEQGYVKTNYVAYLMGVRKFAVLAWPIPHLSISGGNYYKWEAVLHRSSPDEIIGLGLPSTAIEALNMVIAKKNKAKTPVVPELVTAVEPAAVIVKPKKKRGPKPKAVVEVLPDPRITEPDVQDPAFPCAPSAHPLSKYLGNTLKFAPAKLEELPEYSFRVPSFENIGFRKWKCDRLPGVSSEQTRDWWQGEYINEGDDLAVRWSKILIFIDHKKNTAPPASMTETEIADTVANDSALATEYGAVTAPVMVAPEPLPVIARPKTLACKRCSHDVAYHTTTGCVHPDCVNSAVPCKQTPPPASVAA